MVDSIDQEARTQVAEVRHDLANHKMVIEIKLDNAIKTVTELKSQLKWAGGLIVALFLSTLTWSLTQQYNANEAQKKDMSQQIELLRQAERSRLIARQEILNRLPPGGSETTSSADGVAQGGDLQNGRSNNGTQN